MPGHWILLMALPGFFHWAPSLHLLPKCPAALPPRWCVCLIFSPGNLLPGDCFSLCWRCFSLGFSIILVFNATRAKLTFCSVFWSNLSCLRILSAFSNLYYNLPLSIIKLKFLSFIPVTSPGFFWDHTFASLWNLISGPHLDYWLPSLLQSTDPGWHSSSVTFHLKWKLLSLLLKLLSLGPRPLLPLSHSFLFTSLTHLALQSHGPARYYYPSLEWDLLGHWTASLSRSWPRTDFVFPSQHF